MSEDRETNGGVEHGDSPRDRARRRLLKQGIYLAPAVLSMTSFLGKAHAQATAKPTTAATAKPTAAAGVAAKPGVKAKPGVTVA